MEANPKIQNKHKITLLGETIRLLSDEPQEHINAIASLIDEYLQLLVSKTGGNIMSPSAKFLYVNIILADRLLKEQYKTPNTQAEVERDSLKEELCRMQKELEQAKNELEQTKIERAQYQTQCQKAQMAELAAKQELNDFIQYFDNPRK